MIDSNELMRGNYFEMHNPMRGDSVIVQFDWDMNVIDIEGYGEGIELTPKILLDCGFKLLDQTDDVFVLPLSYKLELSIDLTNECYYLGWKHYTVEFSYPTPPLKYVHRLQNLYEIIVGVPLKINL